jgi:hypothetical protein
VLDLGVGHVAIHVSCRPLARRGGAGEVVGQVDPAGAVVEVVVADAVMVQQIGLILVVAAQRRGLGLEDSPDWLVLALWNTRSIG